MGRSGGVEDAPTRAPHGSHAYQHLGCTAPRNSGYGAHDEAHQRCRPLVESVRGVRCCLRRGDCSISANRPWCVSDCRQNVTHAAAARACAAVGRRLCSAAELASDSCCRRGCALDAAFVWTDSACSPKSARARTLRHAPWWEAEWATASKSGNAHAAAAKPCPPDAWAPAENPTPDGFGSMFNKLIDAYARTVAAERPFCHRAWTRLEHTPSHHAAKALFDLVGGSLWGPPVDSPSQPTVSRTPVHPMPQLAVLARVRGFYDASPKPPLAFYHNASARHVAVHVRAGDKDTPFLRCPARVSNCTLRLRHVLRTLDTPTSPYVVVHVFSEAERVAASLGIRSSGPLQVEEHTDSNEAVTFHHLVSADVLVLASGLGSQFSRTAALLRLPHRRAPTLVMGCDASDSDGGGGSFHVRVFDASEARTRPKPRGSRSQPAV